MPQPIPNILNQKIEFIESLLSEEMLLATEELLDKEPILKATQISKGLWETIVQDQNIHFSASVQLTKKLLKKYSCDCVEGRKNELCKHVVVSIYHIRKQQKEDLSKSKSRRPKTRLNLRSFVEKISPDQLQSFALEYARKNRPFRLVMQARFIAGLEEEELPSFFESIYPTHTRTDQKVTAANLSVFIAIANELLDHFKGLLHREEFTQAYFLIHQVLVKSFYIKHYIRGPHKGFDAIHDNLLKSYKECHRLIEAPEYREYMISQLVELLSSSFIDAADIGEQELWMIAYEHPTYYKMLEKSISDYLERKNALPQGTYFITMLSLLISDAKVWVSKITDFTPQDTYQIVQILIRHNGHPKANEILKYFLLTKDLNHTIAKNILDSTVFVLDDDLENRLIEFYIRLKKKYYLNYLQKNSKSWAGVSKKLYAKLSETNEEQLLIEYHLFNKEVTEAAAIINESKSWKLIQQYDTDIIALSEKEGYKIYLDYVLHYLKDHFGSVASQHLEIVLVRARLFGSNKWVSKIDAQIQTTYPHRDW